MTYRIQDVFTVIADPKRRKMLDYLSAADRTAGDIASKFEISRPAVANHLRILEENGLINIEKIGRTRVHKLNAAPLLEIRDWINSYERFWDNKLTGLKLLIESDLAKK